MAVRAGSPVAVGGCESLEMVCWVPSLRELAKSVKERRIKTLARRSGLGWPQEETPGVAGNLT